VGCQPGQVLVRCSKLAILAPADDPWAVAKKQRIIDATKMLLDIAKESSDVFPPLKSCLGGINALIKHYDVRRYRVTLDYANDYQLAIQRRERQAQRSHPMVGGAVADLGEGDPR